ncbi:MAG: InlB B-repeat-containing protein, partial [Clostridia bacterium]|nr:InlB B-repeat-containing protein [Clostridia bacterium]
MKKLLSLLLSVFMIAGLIPLIALPEASAAWNGSTPSSQPSTFTVSGNNYYIKDEQALAWFAKTVTNGTTYSGKTVYLSANLNMNNSTFDGIGTANKSFSGTFQGQGYTISNLKIYRSGDSRAALFNSVSGTVTINNLKLSNVSVSTSGSGGGWHAALVAKVESGSNTTTVSNITVTTASITSKDQTGGIVGYGQAPLTISNCTVTGLTINATDVNAGGIVGISDKAFTISNCSVSGTINGKNRTGGIIGKAEASGNSITNCTMSGTITSSGLHVGGICGNFNNDGSFEFRNCTNNATIQATQEVAGILGYSKGHSNFYYCTNNGAITGTTDTGDRGVGCAAGILANNEDDELIFDHCTNTGTITGKRCSGGICGDTGSDDTANFTYCYNLGNVTDTVARAAGITANSDTGGSEKYYYCINYGNISSKSRTAGIVVGEETALDIYRCANFGNIYGSGDYDCGGICDSNTGTTNECFNMGEVHKASNSSYSIGGISGAKGTVTNCYNGGKIHTANHVAGIAAYNVKVSNCYNYGNVTDGKHGNYQIRCNDGGSVTNCYYLNTASGTAQGTAKTSAELKELSGSLSSSFVKDTWGINNGYPILKWWRDEYFRFPVRFYDGKTGTYKTNATTYNYNATITAPTWSNTGYTFNGWYTASSGGTKMAGSGGTFTAGVTSPMNTYAMTRATDSNFPYVLTSTNPVVYYAQWTAHTYTVAYNGNGSTSGSTASSSHTYDVAKALTSNGFTRKFTVTYNYNYTGSTNTSATATATFNGWATSSGGSVAYTNGQSVSNLTSTNGATVNLYAKWTDASVTLPTPTRTGYTFGGWYGETGCTTSVGAGGASYTPSENKTLYAKWTPITYTVTYDGNGKTGGSTASSTHTYDTAKNLTANGYSREYTVNYDYQYKDANNNSVTGSATATATFNGWATSATGAKVYDNKQSVLNLRNTAGAFPLFANWTLAKVTLPNPTRGGYQFGGWFTNSACTTGQQAGGAEVTPTANITYYAKWTPNTFKVHFNGNGATSGTMADQSFTYDVSQHLTENAFKKEYTVSFDHKGGSGDATAKATAAFCGWAITQNGNRIYLDNEEVGNLTATNNGTANLWAVWGAIPAVTLPDSSLTGYTFNGWYSDADLTNKVGDAGATYTPASDGVTLYAKHTINTYTITFKGADGTVLKNETVEHGQTPNAPDIPGKDPTDTQHFSGAWNTPVVAATGPATYTVVYTGVNHSGGEATCKLQVVCGVCGTPYGETDGTNHKNTRATEAVTANCVTEGFTAGVWCDDCNTYISGHVSQGYDTTEAGHVYGGWQSNGNNTHTKTCSRCAAGTANHTVTANCSGGTATCKALAICDDCGAAYGGYAAHQLTEVPAVAPSCLEPGHVAYWHCEVCEKNFTNATGTTEITAFQNSHTPAEAVQENVTPATCKDEGNYEEVVYCSVCGAELSRETKTIEKLTTHTPGEAVQENVTPATCKDAGSYEEVVYCSVCHAELSRETKSIAKLTTHTPAEAVQENVTPATCKDAGSYEEVVYCSVCGAELSRETKTIEKLTTHTPAEAVQDIVTPATCKDTG